MKVSHKFALISISVVVVLVIIGVALFRKTEDVTKNNSQYTENDMLNEELLEEEDQNNNNKNTLPLANVTSPLANVTSPTPYSNLLFVRTPPDVIDYKKRTKFQYQFKYDSDYNLQDIYTIEYVFNSNSILGYLLPNTPLYGPEIAVGNYTKMSQLRTIDLEKYTDSDLTTRLNGNVTLLVLLMRYKDIPKKYTGDFDDNEIIRNYNYGSLNVLDQLSTNIRVLNVPKRQTVTTAARNNTYTNNSANPTSQMNNNGDQVLISGQIENEQASTPTTTSVPIESSPTITNTIITYTSGNSPSNTTNSNNSSTNVSTRGGNTTPSANVVNVNNGMNVNGIGNGIGTEYGIGIGNGMNGIGNGMNRNGIGTNTGNISQMIPVTNSSVNQPASGGVVQAL